MKINISLGLWFLKSILPSLLTAVLFHVFMYFSECLGWKHMIDILIHILNGKCIRVLTFDCGLFFVMLQSDPQTLGCAGQEGVRDHSLGYSIKRKSGYAE